MPPLRNHMVLTLSDQYVNIFVLWFWAFQLLISDWVGFYFISDIFLENLKKNNEKYEWQTSATIEAGEPVDIVFWCVKKGIARRVVLEPKTWYLSKRPYFAALHFLRDNFTSRKTASNLDGKEMETDVGMMVCQVEPVLFPLTFPLL